MGRAKSQGWGMGRARGRSLRVLVSVVGIALGACVLSLGLLTLFLDLDTLGHYRELAEEAGLTTDPTSPGCEGGESAPKLGSSLPSEAVAWVRVEGTSIDLPVASGSRGFTWYLKHDLWNRTSELGCPFIDPRCPSQDATHVIVYAHHLSLTDAMFTPLHRCYRQGEFDNLGSCVWTTEQASTKLAPLCSLSVKEDYADILRFSFSGTDVLHEWLSGILSVSTAQSRRAQELVAQARRVVTLVTCSSNLSGQPWRTLVLFVG